MHTHAYTVCADVNECEGETSLCDVDNETCSNLIGSFSCKCKTGLIRVEGKCVDKVVKTNESKKKTKKRKKPQKGIAEDDVKRTEFPWYHILAPLTVAIVTYKYSEPNLVTSAILTFVLAVTAMYG